MCRRKFWLKLCAKLPCVPVILAWLAARRLTLTQKANKSAKPNCANSAVRGGAHLAGATNDQLLALTHFADLLGLAFQITDDILDVEGDPAEMGKSAGSDEKKHKSTYVSLYTLAGAKALAEKTVAEALECLDSFGEKAEPLRRITKMMCGRKS